MSNPPLRATTPTTGPAPTALIAEDEPLLAASLARDLAALWPELRIVATVGDGHSAVKEALRLQPDILFFDVRMPGLDGLDAASDIADAWSDTAQTALPQLVFVTAYDEYAVRAFERAAIDYLIKPVQCERLAQCVQRLQQHHLSQHYKQKRPSAHTESAFSAIESIANSRLQSDDAEADDPQLIALHALHNQHRITRVPPLQRITASVGSSLVMVPIEEVLYFEAADKYVRVVTATRELLIRTPIKDLLPQLAQAEFCQIHRSTVVRASAIERITRGDDGKLRIELTGRSERLTVSRLYAHLFKAM